MAAIIASIMASFLRSITAYFHFLACPEISKSVHSIFLVVVLPHLMALIPMCLALPHLMASISMCFASTTDS